jgi:hypothetical protein
MSKNKPVNLNTLKTVSRVGHKLSLHTNKAEVLDLLKRHVPLDRAQRRLAKKLKLI